MPWQLTMRTEDRGEAEAWLTANGWGFEWLENGDLLRTRRAPACRAHPVTGELCWANQIASAHASYFHAHPSYPVRRRRRRRRHPEPRPAWAA